MATQLEVINKEEGTNADTTVTAGRLVAEFKRKEDSSEVDYDITIGRSTDDPDSDSHQIESSDVPDLARLAKKLASAVAADPGMEQEIRDDLACLAACLEAVLPSGYVFPGLRCRERSVVWWSLAALLNYLWDVEGRSYRKWPSSSHPFRKIVQLDAWMRGVGPTDGIPLPELEPEEIQEPFGVCPICGGNDGYLNFGRGHWFYCRKHEIRWFAGDDLFSTWRSESTGDWKKNFKDIGHFQTVEAAYNPYGC